MKDKIKAELSLRTETIIFVILTVVALLLRINHLSADPPAGLSTSQGIYTDPAQYISYARNYVLWGSFNPLHDFRLVFFLKSITTLVSLIVYKIAGVGYLQSNLVGLIFSFPTIILLYFAVRKIAGNLAAVFYLLFITFDYNQIFYGRLSFLENGMNFMAILSFTILIYGRRYYALLLAGICLAGGIFFGKIIGLIYLFPFTCYAVYEYYHDYRPDLSKLIKKYIFFIIGFLAVLVFWYLFSYRPAAASVTGYVEEQAFNLYGLPKAFTNLYKFIYNYVSFGASSHLFFRMPIPSLLTWGIILIFVFRAGFRKSWKNKLFGINPGILFLLAFVVAAYGSLMIWNYRPLRYQTMLIYPVCALGGIFLVNFLSGIKTGLPRLGYLVFPIIFYLLALIPVYQIMDPFYKLFDWEFNFLANKEALFIVTLFLTIAVFVILKFGKQSFFKPPRQFRYTFIAIALLTAAIPSFAKYYKWAAAPTYNTVYNAKDLATILSPEAVISGPYAADFTQDNKILNLIHMFGVANVDSAFFKRYPITHLIMDKYNAEAAIEQYPQIMDRATVVCQYFLPKRAILLYRVAGATGNRAADNYGLSDFEMAIRHYTYNNLDSGNYYMQKHLTKHSDNMSANYLAGVRAYDLGFPEEAEFLLKKAIEFAPTSYHLHFRLGEFYIALYKNSKNTEFKNRALAEFDKAKKYNPESKQMVKDINEMLEGAEKASHE